MSKLVQTVGKLKLEGIIEGITNEKAYNEGFTSSEKPYKSLAFFVKTSPINKVRVELFGMERDQVVAYSQKEKDKKKVNWDARHDDHGDYKVLGVNMFLEKGKDGKNLRKVLVEYDAIDYIMDHLKEGDSVRLSGRGIDFGEYEDQEGNKKNTTRFPFNSITKLNKEIDFEAEDFKEVSMFEQEIVVMDTEIDSETKKLHISAKTINYNGDHFNAEFVVNGEELPKLANNMAKRLSTGDFIKVYGVIVNSAIRSEVEDDDKDVSISDDDDWGGDNEIQESFNTEYITNYVNELKITSVDSSTYEKQKYNEEDFYSTDQEAFEGNVNFDDDDEDEDDELPF